MSLRSVSLLVLSLLTITGLYCSSSPAAILAWLTVATLAVAAFCVALGLER